MVKILPVMHETRVRSLGQEDPLVEEMATHCSILAWKIPWSEEPGRLQFIGSQRAGHDFEYTHTHPKVHHLNHIKVFNSVVIFAFM